MDKQKNNRDMHKKRTITSLNCLIDDFSLKELVDVEKNLDRKRKERLKGLPDNFWKLSKKVRDNIERSYSPMETKMQQSVFELYVKSPLCSSQQLTEKYICIRGILRLEYIEKIELVIKCVDANGGSFSDNMWIHITRDYQYRDAFQWFIMRDFNVITSTYHVSDEPSRKSLIDQIAVEIGRYATLFGEHQAYQIEKQEPVTVDYTEFSNECITFIRWLAENQMKVWKAIDNVRFHYIYDN